MKRRKMSRMKLGLALAAPLLILSLTARKWMPSQGIWRVVNLYLHSSFSETAAADATIAHDGTNVTVSDTVAITGDVSATGRATIGTLYPGGGCPSLASAATIAPTESCHTLTGSTAITNITTGNFTTGDRLLLIWGGSITLTHGNDISIGLDFAGSSGDVAELVYGGANFSKITTADNTP